MTKRHTDRKGTSKGFSRLYDRLYWLMFPGINLHARERFTVLPKYFNTYHDDEQHRVLDVGCGNGMLGYKSYLKGASVVGITIKDREVERARKIFNQGQKIREERLSFEARSVYDLMYPDSSFDEIICSEVLEHLIYDVDVCRSFYRLLIPGGVLHLCAPNAEHPYNETFPLDTKETGGHVRSGYTSESYRGLLEPLGFSVENVVGLGGPIRQALNRRIKELQARFGAVAGLPLFFLALVLLPFERNRTNPRQPFSIYVKVRKPLEAV